MSNMVVTVEEVGLFFACSLGSFRSVGTGVSKIGVLSSIVPSLSFLAS